LIGALLGFASDDAEAQNRLAAFRNVLQGLGWTEGRNARVEVRWTGDDPEHRKDYPAELITLAPGVIFCSTNFALTEVSRLTKTIPIVFAEVGDPVGSGFVSKLGRPEGNITGFSSFEPTMGSKWLQVLKQIAPSVSRAAVLIQPGNAANVSFLRAAEAVGPSLAIKVNSTGVRDRNEIEQAVTAFATQADGGLIVLPNSVTIEQRDLIIELAARHRLPAVYPYRIFAPPGGLVSYGPNQIEQWRGAATYVDRILKGEKPGDLPVQTPTKFELAINLKTAKALGLPVPQDLLIQADEVIE
jgi:putative ABC transport system substrate-binding protein